MFSQRLERLGGVVATVVAMSSSGPCIRRFLAADFRERKCVFTRPFHEEKSSFLSCDGHGGSCDQSRGLLKWFFIRSDQWAGVQPEDAPNCALVLPNFQPETLDLL